MSRIGWILWGAVSSWLLMAVLAPEVWAGKKDPVELIQAQTEVREESLLDVGIQLFDPGLPEDPLAIGELTEKGIFADVRKSEARYIPMNLVRTLQSSGFWGAVRLVPGANSVDLMVSGTIVKSNGKELKLTIKAVDAMGKEWLDKRYKRDADLNAYMEGQFGMQDPYQSLYNQIANDLLKSFKKKKDDYLNEVRMVSELRFAVDLAPTRFDDYLKVDKKGRYDIEKLPAKEDPVMERLAAIRERDHMFIDTLNEYYVDFYDRMDEPYDHWRAYSYEEQVALDKLRSAARWEKILGAAAIIGGIVASGRGGRAGHTAGEVAVIGGIAALQDGFAKGEESKMHAEALRELAASLDSDVAPLLVDVEGEVMRLTGSVETKYATWRQLLRQIFESETGLPVDPNVQKPTDPVGPIQH